MQCLNFHNVHLRDSRNQWHRCWTQVCLYTCGDLIASVPFFEDAEEGFTTSVVTLLRPAVRLSHLF